MDEDLEITGATAGSPRYIVAYLDVNTNNLYDANGNLYGNSTLATTLGNEFILELHYVQDISTSDNPDNWTPWEGLNGMTVSSTLAFDDNYVHAVEGSVAQDTAAGSPTVRIHVPEISKDVLSSSGNLVFNPFGIEPENAQPNETRPVKQIVSYNAFNFISDDIFEFTIEDAQGLPIDVVGGENATPVRVSDPLYLFVGTDTIYENNIPNRYGEGVFKFPMNINSRKLLKALDYSGASGVSGTMEHNIYVERNTLANIVISGSTFSRNSDGDAVAKDLSDDNTYVFCDWTSGSTSYWTRGKDVTSGTPLYTVSGGTATQTGDTATPVYNTDSVLFRTFAFPFIVRNLVDYGNSITIPVENTDWTKDYIISIIRNNMEIVIGKASTANYGTVLIGTNGNIDVDDGVISVKDASTSYKGVIQIATSEEVTAGTETSKAVVPSTLAVELAKKQDNLSNGNVTTLNTTSGAKIDVNVGDGLDVGVTGTTNANKLIVNEASVKEVLEDVVDDGTEPAVNEIVTADNLRGALSVGQAVDVSCVIQSANDFDFSINGTDWISLSAFKATAAYLNDFYVRLVNGSTTGSHFVGFPTSRGAKFPKVAPGLRYLVLCDVCNSGAETSITTWAGGGSFMNDVPHDLDSNQRAAGQTTYNRIAMIMSDAGNAYLLLRPTAANTTVILHIKNWRQYEVTTLTDEAIAYIAQLPDPDAFFRSTSAYSIRDKYLIKQDMVCPFIPTIEMSNSDLTVAAGLSYKMTYKSDTATTHTITADTIPTLAYGWDTHLQLFVDNNTTVNFQSPLVLEDPLTPNAGHNMTIKWRNGQALVYVDDTDVGYIVTVTAGTENGSLYYGLTNDVGEYITFANTTDGTPIEVDGVTVTRELNILGNGVGSTEISGSYIYSKYGYSTKLSVRGISTNASIIAYKGTFSLYNCSITNAHYTKGINNDTQDTVVGGGVSTNIVGSTLSGLYRDSEAAGGIKGWGIISAYSPNPNKIENSIIQGLHDSRLGIFGANISLKNTRFIDNSYLKVSVSDHFISITGNGGTVQNYITDCYISGTTNTWSTAMPVFVGIDGAVNCTISGSTFATSGDNIEVYASGGTVTFAGTNIINSTVSGAGAVVFADGATVTSVIPEGSMIGAGTINLSGNTNYLTNDLGTITIDGLTITNGLYFGIYIQNENVANLTNCNIIGNTVGDAFVHINSTANISGGTYGIVELDLGAVLNLSGRVNVRKNITGRGVVNLADNTIIDCTGNTNTSVILMGAGSIGDEGAVIVGSGCKVVTSGGSTVSITGGTYYSINNAQNAPTTAQAPYVYGYATVKDSGVYVPVELQNGVVTQVDALVLSRMSCHDARIALMDDCATRHIKYYVKPNDLTKKLDGTASKLDGTDGDVMTEFPKSHFLYIENGTVATSGGNDTKDVVLMSRSAFTYNNVDSDWHKSFYISPDGNTVRNQFMGYYPSYVDADNKMRSISGVYPRVNLRLGSTYYSGTTKVTNTNNPSYLKYAGNNGGTNCNRLHYEWLYHLLITKELTIDTQSISLGFCYMSGTAWSTAYPRLTGYSNQVDFYGGQTFANDNDKDIEAMWSGCSITSNSLVWGTSPDKLQFTTSGNTRTVTAFGWRNGTSPNFSYVYTKFEDGMPQIGDTCYSDASCTVEYGTITAVNTGTASSNRVTSCKYFIENPWSNLWQNQAGYVPIVTAGGVRTTAGFYRTTAINSYETILTFDKNTTDATAQNANVEYVEHPWATANNYVITWNPVTFHAITTGAYGSSKMKDYLYIVNAVDVPRCGLVGGRADNSTFDGLGYETVGSAVGYSNAPCVGRLSA